MLEVGGPVLHVDQYGKSHVALVTAIWGKPEDHPAINVVFVVHEENMADAYGRQVARETSVVAWKNQSAHGRYYIPLEDGKPIAELNPYKGPYYQVIQ